MTTKHVNIPIFIPELACPHQCVFCDQRRITGQNALPSDEEIRSTINEHLETISIDSTEVVLAFFGGSFTGLDIASQEHFLNLIQPYISDGRIQSVRISTRPDYITQEILDVLKKYHVRYIELGAQSLDEEVLLKSGRGHLLSHVEEASHLIKQNDFMLGLQMMTGLPGDTDEKSKETARRIVVLGANETRIYPTLVIQGTALSRLYQSGDYSPQSIENAVVLSAQLLTYFESHKVKVLRVGLFASDSLLNGEFLDGPFHSHFLEMVKSRQWMNRFGDTNLNGKIIYVHPKDLNHAVGYQSCNKKVLQEKFMNVKFKVDRTLQEGEWRC